MVTFVRNGIRFKQRVGAIVLDADKRILLVRSPDGFWFLPGGRVEFMESSQEAVRREMKEELGFACTAERLLWVIEDFYAYQGERVHEIALYYLVRPPQDCAIMDGRQTVTLDEEGTPFEAKWFPLRSLATLDLRPACLIQLLGDIPDVPHHIVFREESEPQGKDGSESSCKQ